MSRPDPSPSRKPLIALIDRANRAMQADMVRNAHVRGWPEIKQAHNAVFATLQVEGNRASDMAQRAGITRQSMGEVVREMVDLGLLEMRPDPDDRRAKVVAYTAEGLAMARAGFGYILEIEERFTEEFGEEDYEATRRVLERLVPLLEGPS